VVRTGDDPGTRQAVARVLGKPLRWPVLGLMVLGGGRSLLSNHVCWNY
jgi:hypothetical protein